VNTYWALRVSSKRDLSSGSGPDVFSIASPIDEMPPAMRLRDLRLKVSMSGKGNCYDNAAVETFFKTLKAELVWRHTWVTRQQVSNALFHYINGFYNTRRKHSAIGGTLPVKFERLSA
jgi:transposase InsO family protein